MKSEDTTKMSIGVVGRAPTWTDVTPIYLAVLSDSKASTEARTAAESELMRMARVADYFVRMDLEKLKKEEKDER